MELPTCPLCIERLDGSITGLYFEMLKKARNYEKEDRWKEVKEKCKTCKKVKKHLENTSDSTLKCQTCGYAQNIWVCLICAHTGCGRYHSAHAQDHYIAANHNFSLELETLR